MQNPNLGSGLAGWNVRSATPAVVPCPVGSITKEESPNET